MPADALLHAFRHASVEQVLFPVLLQLALIIVMALITTIATTPLLRRFIPVPSWKHSSPVRRWLDVRTCL
jgi:hypothetical protein